MYLVNKDKQRLSISYYGMKQNKDFGPNMLFIFATQRTIQSEILIYCLNDKTGTISVKPCFFVYCK